MKNKLVNHLAFCIINTLCFLNTNAQESAKGYKENIEMNFGDKGEVAVVSNIKYNAATWDYIKQQHGTDPSVLRNNIKRQFPKYQIVDFDIKNDDMERTSTIKFSLLGSLKVNENGKWVAELESKNPDITKISDTKFLMVDEGSAQTSKINLPSSASDAKIEKDSFGKAILTYTAPASGGSFGNILKYLGFLVIAFGGFIFYKNRRLNTPNQPIYKKIDSHQAKHIDDAIIINQPQTEDLKKKNNSNTQQR
jgi:hypothetical protein